MLIKHTLISRCPGTPEYPKALQKEIELYV